MTYSSKARLADVKQVYAGPEGDLWELVMGEQIHIGGLTSSQDLAQKANIAPGSCGVDFCCCNGAGMRFLLRYRQVAHMTGVDATDKVIERGRLRCEQAGFNGRVKFVCADVCDCPLPDASADFVWGEDAWCYVENKPAMIREAARVVRPGGIVAFTDWTAGDTPMTSEEAERFLAFMKFPNLLSRREYGDLLQANHLYVDTAQDTGRFGPYMDLYLNMLTMQLSHDALRIIGFDESLWAAMGGEMMFMQQLAHDGKIAQSLFVARKQ